VNPPRILLIGYGNPVRGDDGMGPALADAVEAWGLPHVTVDQGYQLTVEDAASVAEYDAVIFVDASVTGPAPFEFSPVVPAPDAGFSTHHVEPGAVMELAGSLFGASTEAHVLAIRGYAFEMFHEGFSEGAAANLAAALAFLEPRLREGRLILTREVSEALCGQEGEP
jgi:hydrogenase maturation protease